MRPLRLLVLLVLACGARAETPLIPREVLFGNPDRVSPQLSPDGTRLGFLAPVDGVMNVWVGPADHPEQAQPLTHDAGRGIEGYFFAYDNRTVLYAQDQAGEENWRIHAVALDTGQDRDLTPLANVAAQIENVSWRHPGTIVIGLNDRDPRYHDLYTVDLATGQRTLLQQNDGYAGFVTDEEQRVRYAQRMNPDGSVDLLAMSALKGKPFLHIDTADAVTTHTVGFDKSGTWLYLLDSRGRDTAALTRVNTDTGVCETLAQNSRADISGVLMHPTENTVEAVRSTYEKPHWQVLDPAVEADFQVLRHLGEGVFAIADTSLDNRRWVVALIADNGPVRYFLYDRATRQPCFLFVHRKALEGLPLARMHPVVIPSRDGLKLVSYLTLPAESDPRGNGHPRHAVPLVLSVHGGPWARDAWGYDPLHQWLANRGYAVLSVNYRGSTGFGKAFVNAGNREWGRKMQRDLLDGVDWAVREGIADRTRLAILGGSYGGYATLVGLTFTPTTFACGVDIVGPSNLLTLIHSVPPYWQPAIAMFRQRVGDDQTAEGRALLAERSPLTYAGRIVRPLLIGQGANDPRVKQAEADQIVRAMQAKHIPVTYVLYPDEGHGFVRPRNSLSFWALTEAFLARWLGGRQQPLGGDLTGSSLTVPAGAELVPGLPQALGALPKPPAGGKGATEAAAPKG